jgi:crotonobetainyl-CoA:carnitine CoA-transferase CaiB-like acyl-CoA transferase
VARHVGALNDLFAAELATRSSAEWLRLFDAAGIPAMAMHTPDSLLHDPHLNAVGFFQDVEHPSEGAIRTMAVPTRWSATAPLPQRQAPRLGEHSVALLREAGLSPAQIDDLLARGITVDSEEPPPPGAG